MGEKDRNIALVKWATPEEELMGTAHIARGLVECGLTTPDRVCFLVPNGTWGSAMLDACRREGMTATLCLHKRMLSGAGELVLGTLDLLANPDNGDAWESWRALGRTEVEADRLLRSYSGLNGFTLANRLKLNLIPEFEHIVSSLNGEETCIELADIAHRQLEEPTISKEMGKSPIFHFESRRGEFDYVFFPGCVAGLIPDETSLQEPDDICKGDSIELQRRAFHEAIHSARVSMLVSYFTSVDRDSDVFRLVKSTRNRMERGRTVAMTRPSMFLTEQGAECPSIVSGQEYLGLGGLQKTS